MLVNISFHIITSDILVNISFHVITSDMQFKAEKLRKIHHMKILHVYFIMPQDVHLVMKILSSHEESSMDILN